MKTLKHISLALLFALSAIAEGYEVTIAPIKSGDDDSGFDLEMERVNDGKNVDCRYVEEATTINVEGGKYRVKLSPGDDRMLGLCGCSFEIDLHEDTVIKMGLPEMCADIAIPDNLIPADLRTEKCLGFLLEGEVYSEAMQRTVHCTPEFLAKKGKDGTWTGKMYYVLPGVYKLSIIDSAKDFSTKTIGTLSIDKDGKASIKE